MKHVYLIATKSKDPRTHIGAILVRDGIIISEGYNGFARGVKDFEDRYLDRETKYKLVVHGEANAVLNAARHGISTKDSICYTQGMPCCECCKTLIQAGIKEIVIHELWPSSGLKWEESAKWSRMMCEESGVNVRTFKGVLTVTARSNDECFTV